MKKVLLILTIIISSFFLYSCNPDTKEFAGFYVLDSYESTKTDEELGFILIEKYDLELKKNGIAKHTIILGVMLEEEIMTSGFEVNKEKYEISFRHQISSIETYTDIYYYDDEFIIMNDLEVAIVDEPDFTNKDHYVLVTIKLKKVS